MLASFVFIYIIVAFGFAIQWYVNMQAKKEAERQLRESQKKPTRLIEEYDT